ncbi:MAG: LysE family transporter [Bacteroidota bacterium]
MFFLAHLAAGFVLSFIGSLPLGVINVTVADTTIQRGIRAGVWVALGASLVEMVQAWISIQFSDLWMGQEGIDRLVKVVSIGVFFLLALYFLWKKPSNPEWQSKKETASTRYFFKGVLVSAINLLAFPYWIFYGTYLGSEGWLTDGFYILVFAFGVMLGTLALLLLYARMSLSIVDRLQQIARLTDKFIGVIFLILGSIQLIRLLL